MAELHCQFKILSLLALGSGPPSYFSQAQLSSARLSKTENVMALSLSSITNDSLLPGLANQQIEDVLCELLENNHLEKAYFCPQFVNTV